MRFLPHTYQFEGIATIIQTRFLALFLDPGLGKTSIVLRAFLTLRKQRKIKAMLVIAPLRVCHSVWPKEVRKWSFSQGFKVRILHGFNKSFELKQDADIYIINPEGLKWLLKTGLRGKRNWPFDMLVVDESSRFKNHESKVLAMFYPKLLKFRRRYILNGTPAPRGYVDLFAQMLLVDRGEALGRYITHFREDFLTSDYMGWKWSIRSQACADEMKRRLAPKVLVMRAKDYLDMPPITFAVRGFDLPDKVMTHYREVERELFTELETDLDENTILDLANVAVATGACRQICSGAIYEPLTLEQRERPPPSHKRLWHELHTAKLEACLDLIAELQGKPLFIGYEFHHSYVRLWAALTARYKGEIAVINRFTKPQEGVKIEDRWNRGGLRVLLAHTASVQYGLNLQDSGDDVCWFDPTWSLDTFIQFVRRVYRQGKERPVRCHQLAARGTIERLMLRRLIERHDEEVEIKTGLQRYRRKLSGKQ